MLYHPGQVSRLDLLPEFPDSPDFHCHRYSRPVLSSELLPALRSVPHPVSALPLVYPLYLLRCPHPVSELPLVPPPALRSALRPAFPSVLPLALRLGSPLVLRSALHPAFPSDPELVLRYLLPHPVPETRLAQALVFPKPFLLLFLLPEQPHIRLLSPRFHLPQKRYLLLFPRSLFSAVSFDTFPALFHPCRRIPDIFLLLPPLPFCWYLQQCFFRLFSRPPAVLPLQLQEAPVLFPRFLLLSLPLYRLPYHRRFSDSHKRLPVLSLSLYRSPFRRQFRSVLRFFPFLPMRWHGAELHRKIPVCPQGQHPLLSMPVFSSLRFSLCSLGLS